MSLLQFFYTGTKILHPKKYMPDKVEQNNQTLPEIDHSPGKQLIVCSLGRGGLIADQIHVLVPGSFPETLLVDPQVPIPEYELDKIFNYIEGDRLLRKQVRRWIEITTEGRPTRDAVDYVYSSKNIGQVHQDVTRIATLKFRALFPQLFSAFKENKRVLRFVAISRDTCSLIKTPQFDSYIYQSHPGPDKRDQLQQFLEVFNAEYTLIGTSTIIVSGVFPTQTPQEIYQSLVLLYGFAFGLDIKRNFIPSGAQIAVFSPFHLAAFRISPDVDDPRDMLHTYSLANKPGGINWDHWALQEVLECWQFPNGNPYLEYPSSDYDRYGILDINSGIGERWTPVHSLQTSWGHDPITIGFSAIRQGMPPTSCLQQIFGAIVAGNQTHGNLLNI